jgi:cytochrome P450
MAAGHETTAGALIWTLHVLTKYPDMQTRLREEIKANIPETGIPSFNEVEDLKFLNNLTREILRYYSPGMDFLTSQVASKNG